MLYGPSCEIWDGVVWRRVTNPVNFRYIQPFAFRSAAHVLGVDFDIVEMTGPGGGGGIKNTTFQKLREAKYFKRTQNSSCLRSPFWWLYIYIYKIAYSLFHSHSHIDTPPEEEQPLTMSVGAHEILFEMLEGKSLDMPPGHHHAKHFNDLPSAPTAAAREMVASMAYVLQLPEGTDLPRCQDVQG